MTIERPQTGRNLSWPHVELQWTGLPVALLAAMAVLLSACSSTGVVSPAAATRFAVDPYWPKSLPGNWQVGAVAGVAVDRHDHIWIIHRPGSFTDDEKAASFDPPRAVCCVPAPSVVEFDADGKVLRSWGMAGAGFDFPKREHGIYVDQQDNVWIAGNHEQDHQILKFTAD